MARLWDKGEPVDELVLRFTTGDDPLFDQRLVSYDLKASAAHATMLAEAGYLKPEELEALVSALEAIGAAHEAGEWAIQVHEEDCHTAIENQLTERLGPLGGRIHLARSRNDQVLAALRLYLKDAVADLVELGEQVVLALRGVEADQGSIALPGYTHLQRAMPQTVALWAGAFRAEIEDDLAGLQASLRRVDRNPLGSAAGYGVPVLDIDRERTRELLGFGAVHEPVTAVQLSRGKAEAGILFELVLLSQDLARLSEDVILFASSEFGFVRLPSELTTGSSIMPQKRNPDVFELVRGRAAVFGGHLQTALGLMAKLGAGYHRDLQLLKDPLFRGLDSMADVLRIMARAIPGLSFQKKVCEAALDRGLFATERAYRLVKDDGVPFRDAYRRVAGELREEAGD